MNLSSISTRLGRACAAGAIVLAAAASLTLTGCSTPPQTYSTPDAAVDSLIGALRTDNTAELKKILGSDSTEALNSGDAVDDANRRADFLRLYDEQHGLAKSDDGSMTLEVGATRWPMPFPLVEGDVNGKKGWYFDTDAGLDEMLSRRIGRNELDTIQVCLAIADAEREYASRDFTGDGWREYARKFRSDPGKRNGLWWPAEPGQPESPLGELVAYATDEGYSTSAKGRQPFHGYYYKILTAQGPAAPGGALDFVVQGHMIGGFAVIAWPAEYARSGLKSFLVSHHGTVYERDLGDDTASIARSMATFDPTEGWVPVGYLVP